MKIPELCHYSRKNFTHFISVCQAGERHWTKVRKRADILNRKALHHCPVITVYCTLGRLCYAWFSQNVQSLFVLLSNMCIFSFAKPNWRPGFCGLYVCCSVLTRQWPGRSGGSQLAMWAWSAWMVMTELVFNCPHFSSDIPESAI